MRVLPTVNLTGHQLILLAKIVTAPESPEGGKRVHLNDEKLVQAKDLLVKLKLITFNEETGHFTISEKASVLMQEEGLTNEDGELTDKGQQFAAGELPSEEDIKKNSKPETLSPMEKFHISFKDYLTLIES